MTALFSACTSSSDSGNAPTAVIQKKVPLPDIPSASGIEKVGNKFYVIGDDSPFLFCLNAQYKVIQKVALLEKPTLSAGRIAKAIKADFESITSFIHDERPYLLIFGSGSTARRNVGYLVPVTTAGAGKPISVSLEPLYASLAKDPQIIGKAMLNIEGLAADEEYLYLLQRFAPGGQNVLVTYTMDGILPFLLGKGTAPKPHEIRQWKLPELERISTGFSGITASLGGRLLFTASAEETPDAVLDGEVYGSLVGWLHAHQSDGQGPQLPTVTVPVTDTDGTLYKGKIESICILDQDRHSVQAVAVTDNDDGLSELVELTFTW